MKKYKLYMVTLVCAVLLLFLLTRNGITLQGMSDTYPQNTTSISVRLKNNTLKTVEYGAAFSIDQYVDGEWMRLENPDKPVFFELWSKTLSPFFAVNLTYPISGYSDFQEVGTYRLVIDVRSGTETQTLYYSFTITDK